VDSAVLVFGPYSVNTEYPNGNPQNSDTAFTAALAAGYRIVQTQAFPSGNPSYHFLYLTMQFPG
jgi:hypothetical protein